ncbi:hypothetical protein [Oceanobacillus halotolerans]|nr:hypothetical protein [Oceanobacillus halotolerans]
MPTTIFTDYAITEKNDYITQPYRLPIHHLRTKPNILHPKNTTRVD